jgi:anti-sigma-K factor RskA
MIRDHSTIEELLAAAALGGLDDDDVELLARERATHGDCEECRRLEDGFAETAGRLAFTLDPETVDPASADRILAAEGSGDAAGPFETTERLGRRWMIAVALAAALAVIVVAASTLRPGTTAIVDASPSQQIIRFDGTGEGTLTMAYTPGHPGAVFWGSDMPDPGAGQVYEIWMIQDGDATSGGCVQPQDGSVALSVDADIGASELMAVTVEDAACPTAPTSGPVLSAELPPAV